MILIGESLNVISKKIGRAFKERDPKPIQEAIDKYNHMYQEGNIIIYWTARGCVSGKDYLEQTRSQLKQFGVLYHSVRIGKPHYDKLYCDKAYNSILNHTLL